MRLLLGALLALIVAAAIGLGTTWFALTRNIAFGAMKIGSWTAYPQTGGAEIDPYAHAEVARNGILPVGLGDGLAFIARTDDYHHPLDGRCDVVLRGTTPQARFFTLTIYDRNGQLIPNAMHRYGFTSRELVRKADGEFEVTVAPRARPGNWLPTGGVERYVLVLRFYDTPVGVATRAEREAPMPAVVLNRGTCS